MSQKRILLLEDNEIEAQCVFRAIRKLGLNCTIEHKINGEEGLNYLLTPNIQLPSLIITDLNMPKMSGIEFITHLKQAKNLRKIPILVLTTSSNELDLLSAFNQSVAGYIKKPMEFSQFISIMEVIFNYWCINEDVINDINYEKQ